MPQDTQLAHRVLTNLALPYVTNVSPSSTEPQYISGSHDILTSIAGYAERRPGFSNFVEQTPTTFNNLQRLFTWDRFDGTFIVMACDINAAGFAVVYEMRVGIDASFTAIYTEPTASGVPFDFVVSNNTVYFSNGVYTHKWDPVNGASNWGIAQYVASGSTNLYASSGTNVTGHPWTSPGNIVGAPNLTYATNQVQAGSSGTGIMSAAYAFAIPVGNTISGLQVDLTGHVSTSAGHPFALVTFTIDGVNGIGLNHGIAFTSTTDFTVTLGGPSDLWGWSPTPTNVNVATTPNFGVTLQCGNDFGFTDTFSLDACKITIYNSGAPAVTVSASAGTMSATVGYQYVICYFNSNTGHTGSPSPVSNSTGVFTNKLNVSIPLVASTDPQVTNIRVFRTTDSASGLGGQSYFEIPGSPFPNTTGTVTDNAPDSALSVSAIAPTPTFNDPPTPMRGMVYYAGRIWGFTGNKVWFTGLEEITIGVPEESMPSGIAGNFWAFDQPVQGLAAAGIGANQALAVFCGGRMYVVQGSTLDTFVRYQISNRRGCRNLTCISTLGGMVSWFDSASQVWGFDGTNMNEISPMIRPDLVGLNPATCSMTFHTAGRFHWLVLSTGTKLYVFDVDQDQWMPPWNFAAKYIFSGEISPGNYVLMASNGTTALQLNPAGTAGTFNDDSVTYQPVMKFGLLSVIPDYGTRFSYIGVGSYNEPTRTGYPNYFQVTNNGQKIIDFLICSDENPNTAAYQTIGTNLVDTTATYNRANGSQMVQNVYTVNAPASRWIGMEVKYANADQVDQMYEVFMAYKALGGR